MGIRGKVLIQLFDNLRAQGLSFKEALDEVRKATLDDAKIKQLLAEKKSWDDLKLSIDGAKNHLEAFIATHKSYFFGPGGIIGGATEGTKAIASFFTVPGAPGTQGALPLAPGAAGTPTKVTADAILLTDAKKENAELIIRAEIIAGKTKIQGELEEKRKELNEAIRLQQGLQAVELAKQVHTLETSRDLEAERLTLIKHLQQEAIKYQETLPRIIQLPAATVEKNRNLAAKFQGGTGGVYGPFSGPAELQVPQLSNEQVSEYYKKQYGAVNPVDQAIGVDSGDILKKGQSFEKLNDEFLSRYQSVVDKVASDNADAIAKAQREYDKDLTVFQRYLDEKLIGEQEFQDARTKLYAIEQSKIQKLQDEENKKYKDEAGKLFDDLISGKPKEFAKSLQHDLMEAVLAPIKNIFEQMLGGTLASISHAASVPFGGAAGAGGGILGGILGRLGGLGAGLGGRIGPGGTAGWWPGQVGGGVSGAAGAPSVGVSAGQVGVATPVMNVHADIVNISGSLAIPGAGPLGSTTGNFFGNLNPFANNAITGPIGLAGIGGIGSSGELGGVLSSLGPILGAGALIGAGAASNNPTAMAMGAATLAQSGIKSLTQFGGLISSNSAIGQTLGTIAPGLPGVGLFAAGVAQGGVGGTIESTLGGAQAGLAYGGPIGAAIGAGVGLISGVVSTLIQGPSFAQRVKQKMYNQAYRLPPSEQFSFAMGNSISQTLSTGFNQSGNTFGTYGLQNTPFFANPITGRLSRDQQIDLARSQIGILSNQPFGGFPTNDPFVGQGNIGRYKGTGTPNVHFNITAIDSKGVADFITEHGSNIARMLNSSSPYSSASGFAKASRAVVNLP